MNIRIGVEVEYQGCSCEGNIMVGVEGGYELEQPTLPQLKHHMSPIPAARDPGSVCQLRWNISGLGLRRNIRVGVEKKY